MWGPLRTPEYNQLSNAYHSVLRAVCDMQNHKGRGVNFSNRQVVVASDVLVLDLVLAK